MSGFGVGLKSGPEPPYLLLLASGAPVPLVDEEWEEGRGREGDPWRVCGDSEPVVTRQRMVPNTLTLLQLRTTLPMVEFQPLSSILSQPATCHLHLHASTHDAPNPTPISTPSPLYFCHWNIFPTLHPLLHHFLPSPAYQLPPTVLGEVNNSHPLFNIPRDLIGSTAINLNSLCFSVLQARWRL